MAIFRVNEAIDNGSGNRPGTLSWAIFEANQDPAAATIVLETDVIITDVMRRLINSDITITGDDPDTPVIESATISGINEFRPLFVKSGTVNLNNLTLTENKALGGSSRTGGGGAGMGGALFIYNGNVTIENAQFTNNTAQGGSSGVAGLGSGGGGMFGSSFNLNGGGLFDDSTPNTGDYGGFSGFGIGGGLSGGFGGGGSGGHSVGTRGGFGGGGTFPGFGAGERITLDGGGGAGFGGAIFIRSGNLTIFDTTFNNNSAIGGTSANPGQGLGGAIFAMTSTRNTNGNHLGMPSELPVVELENVTFTSSDAADATGTAPADGIGLLQNNNDIYGTTEIVSDRLTVITAVTVPDGQTYGIGAPLDFTVTFSEAVTITGRPTLPITLDTGGVVNATLVGNGSSATTHTFRYTLAEGNEALDGIEVGSELVLTDGATIVDNNGISAVVTLNNIGDTTAIRVDGIPPDAPTITTTGATNTTTPEITGTAEAGSTVAILNNGEQIGEVQADANGNWSFTPGTPLPEGEISLTATVTNAAGNVSVASTPVSLTIDTSIEEDPIEEDPIEEDPIEEDPIEEDPIEEDPIEEDSGTDDSGTDDSGTDDSGTDDSGTDDSGTGSESSRLIFQILEPTGPGHFNQFLANNQDSALNNPVSTPLVDVASILADVPDLANFSFAIPTLPTLEIFLNNTPGTPFLIGTPEPEYMVGTNEGEFIQGLGGNDQIFGLSGNDIIHGNQGDDFIDAGPGDDVVHGGKGNDFILAHSGNNQIYGDLGDDTLVGGPGNDFMNGNQGKDLLFAVAGNNILHGGQGEDTLVGGTGSDVLFGDKGDDLIYAGSGNNFLYGNQGNDTLIGGDEDDVLWGGQGDDLLIGGAGNDWLMGDLGNDTLIGGAGVDRFVIRKGAGVDFIVDFTDEEDLIGLAEGLTYNDLTLTQGSDGAQISVGNEVLAILNGVDIAVLDVQDFFEVV